MRIVLLITSCLLVTVLSPEPSWGQIDKRPRTLPARRPQAKRPVADLSATENPVPVVLPARESYGHWRLGVFYNLANKVKYRGVTELLNGPAVFNATDNTRPAFGIGIGYLRARPNSFGFDAGLSYELPRGSDGLDAELSTGTAYKLTYVGDPKISIAAAQLNGNYTIGSWLTLAAGFNFPVIASTDPSVDLKGLIGYQAGANLNLFDKLSLDVSYRVIGLKGTTKAGTQSFRIDEATMQGLVVGVSVLAW